MSGELNPSEVANWLLAFVRGLFVSAASGVDASELTTCIRVTEKQIGLG